MLGSLLLATDTFIGIDGLGKQKCQFDLYLLAGLEGQTYIALVEERI